MGIMETNVSVECQKAVSQCGARVFRNNRGLFYPIDAVKRLLSAFKTGGMSAAMDLVNSGCLRKQRAGLDVAGSSDLIGWTSEGKFLAIEIKTLDGRVTPEQEIFIENVLKMGGVAGICRNKNDVYKLLDRPDLIA